VRPQAQEGLLLRQATQVQARTQQVAAADGQIDHVLEVTHAMNLAGAGGGRQGGGQFAHAISAANEKQIRRARRKQPDGHDAGELVEL